MRSQFTFQADIQKAVTDEGRLLVEAVVSDTLVDHHGERMSRKCLDSMAAQARNGLPLLDNHHATFEFGKSVAGFVDECGDHYQLRMLFELDPVCPTAQQLFREVSREGGTRKQLSIGGFLDTTRPGAVRFDTDTSTNQLVRTIEAIELEHVAATRPNRAANARTGFLDAMMKALDTAGFSASAVAGIVASGAGPVFVWKSESGYQTQEAPVEAPVVAKAVVPHRKYALNRDSTWGFSADDGNAILDKGGWGLFKAAHTIVRGESSIPEMKDPYALPHHKLADGAMVTYLSGVRAAAGALLGARGGVDGVSSEDRAGAAEHLLRHFEEFQVDPPDRLVALSKGIEVEPYTYDEFMEAANKSGPAFYMPRTTWEVATKAADAPPAQTLQQKEAPVVIGKDVKNLADVVKGLDASSIQSASLVDVLKWLEGVLQRALDASLPAPPESPTAADIELPDMLRNLIKQAGLVKSINNFTDDEEALLRECLPAIAALKEAAVAPAPEAVAVAPEAPIAPEVAPAAAADDVPVAKEDSAPAFPELAAIREMLAPLVREAVELAVKAHFEQSNLAKTGLDMDAMATEVAKTVHTHEQAVEKRLGSLAAQLAVVQSMVEKIGKFSSGPQSRIPATEEAPPQEGGSVFSGTFLRKLQSLRSGTQG